MGWLVGLFGWLVSLSLSLSLSLTTCNDSEALDGQRQHLCSTNGASAQSGVC